MSKNFNKVSQFRNTKAGGSGLRIMRYLAKNHVPAMFLIECIQEAPLILVTHPGEMAKLKMITLSDFKNYLP